MIHQVATAAMNYVWGKGKPLWYCDLDRLNLTRVERIERAWLDGVTFGVQASIDVRCKVAAPGWMKGKP